MSAMSTQIPRSALIQSRRDLFFKSAEAAGIGGGVAGGGGAALQNNISSQIPISGLGMPANVNSLSPTSDTAQSKPILPSMKPEILARKEQALHHHNGPDDNREKERLEREREHHISSSATSNKEQRYKKEQKENTSSLLHNSHPPHSAISNNTATATSAPPANAIKKIIKEIDGYVGFANLPNQVYRKAVKKGFEFTLMVVGESGLGKSTLINSMFLADIYSNDYPGPSHRIKKTLQVETTKVLLKEGGVNLLLTIVDTPGFGDGLDNSDCWQPLSNYIESKYEEYLNAESRVSRKSVPDNRVHCCLYFIAPSGHGLKPLDVEFMKKLHDKVNIIPVIGKADTMTPDECVHFKKQILNEIAQNKIKVYEFPDAEEEEESKRHQQMKSRVPFAVVGSNVLIEVDGKKVRGRKYPWGIVEVENLEHCDFIPLRDLLLRTNMTNLKDLTDNMHYENYRVRKLSSFSNENKPSDIPSKNPLAEMEEAKKEHDTKLKKLEHDMEQVFKIKVGEKHQKIKDSENDLQRRHEQMKKSLEEQKRELEQRRREFESEKAAWEQSNGITIQELRRKSLEANSREMLDGKDKKGKKKGLF